MTARLLVIDALPDLNGDGLRMYRRVATMQRDRPDERAAS
jgi:hypothetical protein